MTNTKCWMVSSAHLVSLALWDAASAQPPSDQNGERKTTIVAEEIIVYGRVPQRIDQVGSAVSTFRAEDIALQDLRVLSDVLERLPGVAITRSGGFGQTTQVRMRGFTTKHVLTIVDGVKINNPSAFDNQFGIQHLTLTNVERVEVLRGPQSGLYGADAVAGVVNIVTRRGTGPAQGRVSGFVGRYESRELSAAVSGGLAANSLGLAFGASWFDTEGISIASRAPGNVEPDGYRNLALSVRADWEAAPGVTFRAGGRYSDSRNETDSNFTQSLIRN
jgi:vitamin B12 transporter